MYRDCQKCSRAFFAYQDDEVFCRDCRGEVPAKKSGWWRTLVWLLVLGFLLWLFFMRG